MPINSRRRRRREPSATRIFIIGAHPMYREGLGLLLDREAGFRVVGGSADCVAAARLARECQPDIVLLDLAVAVLPDRDAVRRLAAACAHGRLVVVAPDLEKSATTEALLLGARGVLPKSVPVETLIRSIRAVASGQYWVGREIVSDLLQNLRASGVQTPAPRKRDSGLTARELEILSVLITGCANKEIAARCRVAERTVKHHLTNILQKLGLSSRLELAVYALQHHLVVSSRAG